MTVYEMEIMREFAHGVQTELVNWAVGGGTLMVILLAVVGACAMVKAVLAR